MIFFETLIGFSFFQKISVIKICPDYEKNHTFSVLLTYLAFFHRGHCGSLPLNQAGNMYEGSGLEPRLADTSRQPLTPGWRKNSQ